MSKAAMDIAPRMSVTPAGVSVEADGRAARVDWEVTNAGSEPLQILETWLPHGRFFGERQAFEPALFLGAGATAIIRRGVRYVADPEGVVENAFLNLRVRYGGRLWRILVRVRAHSTTKSPAPSLGLTVEAITVHPIGFALAGTEEVQR